MNQNPTLEIIMPVAVTAKGNRPRHQRNMRMQRVMAPFGLLLFSLLLLDLNHSGVFAWSASPLLNSKSTCFRRTTTIGGSPLASRQSQIRQQQKAWARAAITPCLVSLVSTTDNVDTTTMDAATPEPSSIAATTTTATTTITTSISSEEAVAAGTQATIAAAAQEQQQQQESLLFSFTNNWKEMLGINSLMPSSSSSSNGNGFNLDGEQVRKAVNLLLLTASFGFALYQILNIDHGMTRGWTQSVRV
jgi:hypothetical protein